MKDVKFDVMLRTLRKRENMTQGELAEKLGITQGSLSHYERGEQFPEVPVLLKIGEFFDVSLDQLMYAVMKSANEVIDENNRLLVDLDNNIPIPELRGKYKFVSDGKELTDEEIKAALEQIQFQRFKSQSN
ncbi:helix-turn-helix domain-containing protein [Rummeliibacillus sp. TYF-LIM-RU47]|uniref:helix-turn-helix domain-containing protein n=1 Tax=Rummeliibacillus sp. TYF-LIM-RU47 TaxID=2608406 RepID=UPI001239B3D7|nr:helix-turn-helix transcriptional regulator [Rummeliibacillus sp. TYF-LIM-RU47]